MAVHTIWDVECLWKKWLDDLKGPARDRQKHVVVNVTRRDFRQTRPLNVILRAHAHATRIFVPSVYPSFPSDESSMSEPGSRGSRKKKGASQVSLTSTRV